MKIPRVSGTNLHQRRVVGRAYMGPSAGTASGAQESRTRLRGIAHRLSSGNVILYFHNSSLKSIQEAPCNQYTNVLEECKGYRKGTTKKNSLAKVSSQKLPHILNPNLKNYFSPSARPPFRLHPVPPCPQSPPQNIALRQ